ncbi:MAG: hypothetical protein HOW59_17815 [Nonomuraea sp.]|nr:hypothetical protein [Nonomuraea sp.]
MIVLCQLPGDYGGPEQSARQVGAEQGSGRAADPAAMADPSTRAWLGTGRLSGRPGEGRWADTCAE